MKKYFKTIMIPLIWQGIFLVCCVMLPEHYFVYTNFVFYLGIILYFLSKGFFNWNDLKQNLKAGKIFWKPVFLTILFMFLAFGVSGIPSMIFENFNDGMMNIQRDSWVKLVLFAFSTILFPPIAEELFYRKAMIKTDGTMTILIITTIFSMFLYAIEHSLTISGILIAMVWALPFSISYIKTKNIYIPMTAHFIVNLIANGSSVIFSAVKLLE